MTFDAHFDQELNWYALRVKPRHDKAVAHMLAEKGYATFVPTFKKRHRYISRLKESELPLFPGYVFCQFDVWTRMPVLTTPGVTGIAGAGRTPIPIDSGEMASLQCAIRAEAEMEPYPFLAEGQKVRISEGSLAGIEGIVARVKPRLALVLSITLLQRSVLLEIDRNYVTPEIILPPPVYAMELAA